MSADKRIYITVANTMPEHEKIEGLSDKAFRSLVTLWCWSSRNQKDGFIPESVWLRRTNAKVRAELLAAMAEPRPGGVYMHDYLEHQLSKAEIEARRAVRSEAGRRGGKSTAAAKAAAKWGQANA